MRRISRPQYKPIILLFATIAVLLSACALQQAPSQSEITEEALPSTTQVPSEWASDAADNGKVDDGWIAAFGDEQLEALVDEVLQNNLGPAITAYGLTLLTAYSEVENALNNEKLFAEAVNIAGWLGMLMGIIWILEMIWAYMKPPAPDAQKVVEQTEAPE